MNKLLEKVERAVNRQGFVVAIADAVLDELYLRKQLWLTTFAFRANQTVCKSAVSLVHAVIVTATGYLANPVRVRSKLTFDFWFVVTTLAVWTAKAATTNLFMSEPLD